MPSLLRWEAARQLAELFAADQRQEEARLFTNEAARIRSALPGAFAKELPKDSGKAQTLLISATELGRKDDVWASAYAVTLGILPPEMEHAVASHLLKLYRQSGTVREGQVRHLPSTGVYGGYWEEALGERDRYQNGGYWGTPTGWLIVALSRVDTQAANALLAEYTAHLRQHRREGAPWEWIQPAANLRVNPRYGSSAGCVVIALESP
jgi:hypothetical protein